jgi:hypothetical protein
VSPSSNSSPARWSPNEMPNRDHGICLAASGEDAPGVMGTNTRQRDALDWTPSLAPPHSRGPEALSRISAPPPSPETTGGGRPVPARQHLSVEWAGMRERTCF